MTDFICEEDDERKESVVIDVSNVRTDRELHQLLKITLDFPEFYGNNWDAFWDAITGLVLLPKRIRFVGWIKLVDYLPKSAELLQECLNDKNDMYPSTSVEIEYG
ncbi:hypothetical protein B5G50_21465 [Brevibacillus brevis]|uniref:barstar family protein n=1 Tax=Brevibacillus brevis TaxID=1393 RepID=UPI000B36C14A|nr:barstar family protein [Brevibacillus brevis]OUQ86504.1 hypothetical protein B5G50_21465 [Brevibacillus brevis]